MESSSVPSGRYSPEALSIVSRPIHPSVEQKTGNGQHCRRRKGLMRHTAMSCFPSNEYIGINLGARRAPRGGLKFGGQTATTFAQTQERNGPPSAVQNFWGFAPRNRAPFLNLEFAPILSSEVPWASTRQLVEQRLRLFQIARVEPLRKPPVNRSQQFACLLHLALVAPEACHAHGRAEFPGFGLLLACD
jgi:hypothetical protein